MIKTNKLKGKIAEEGKTNKELAEMLGIHRSTFQRKLRSGNFSVEEASILKESIPLDDKEASVIFFGGTVAEKRQKQEL